MTVNTSNSLLKSLEKCARPHWRRWPDHLLQFMKKYHIPLDRPALIGLSGGLDSMALMVLLLALKKRGEFTGELRFLHVDHKMRNSSTLEAMKVLGWGKSLGLKGEVVTLENAPLTNRESWARQERYRTFSEQKRAGELLFLGHHIDDSFEWHLMQKFKSASFCPGIPLRRGSLYRPLHAFSRSHLEKFCRGLKIPFITDSSNKDETLERNRMRRLIKRELSESYPSYLKNYVEQFNQLVLEKAPSNHSKGLSMAIIDTRAYQNSLLGRRELAHTLKIQIYALSREGRGKMRRQLREILKRVNWGGGKRRVGPFRLSGGVLVFIRGPYIYLYGQKIVEQCNIPLKGACGEEIWQKLRRFHGDIKIQP